MNLQQAIDKLKNHLGDMEKVVAWMKEPKFALNSRTPLQMIKDKKEKQVIFLINKICK
jgi:hypothetical protein